MAKESIRSARIAAMASIIVGVLSLLGGIAIALINNWPRTSKSADIGRNDIRAEDSNVRPAHKVQGTTYNIVSNNQRGGITAADVLQFRNATIIVEAPTSDKTDLPSGYNFSLDTIKKIIRVQPQKGVWENPFVGIPQEEKDLVNPHVQIQNKKTITATMGIFSIQQYTLFGATSDISATAAQFYSFHYDKIPSFVVFGNYPSGPLFSLSL